MAKHHDFFSDEPPVRIIGSEMEYCVQFGEETQKAKTHPELIAIILDEENLKNLDLLPNAYNDDLSPDQFGSYYLRNGARIYPDVNNFLEYATPESYGPTEAMMTDMAGIKLVKEIVANSEANKTQIYRRVGFAGINNKFSETSGYHENYLTSRTIFEKESFNALVKSFLVSRQVWSGMGFVNSTYSVSQKAEGIQDTPQQSASRVKRGNKPLYMAILDSDTMNSGWARLEIRNADPLNSPTLRFLGFAATSLMLRLAEHDFAYAQLRKYSFLKPEKVNRQIALDTKLNKKYPTCAAGEITALDYQQILAEHSLELSKHVKLPNEEIRAAEMWIQLCDTIKSTDNIDELADQLEWVARRKVISQIMGKTALSYTDNRAVMLDTWWDRVDKQGIGEKWWAKHDPLYSLETTAAIANYVYLPPQKTRARKRVELSEHDEVIGINWNVVSFHHNDRRLADPYQWR